MAGSLQPRKRVKLPREGNAETEGPKFPVFGAMNEQADGIGGIGTSVKFFHFCSRLNKELLSGIPFPELSAFV